MGGWRRRAEEAEGRLQVMEAERKEEWAAIASKLAPTIAKRVAQDPRWQEEAGREIVHRQYWERVAVARAELVTELWQRVPHTGQGNGNVESVFYGREVEGEATLYYWRQKGTGVCSWEWPGEGDGPTAEEVQRCRTGCICDQCKVVADSRAPMTRTQKKNERKRGKKKR